MSASSRGHVDGGWFGLVRVLDPFWTGSTARPSQVRHHSLVCARTTTSGLRY